MDNFVFKHPIISIVLALTAIIAFLFVQDEEPSQAYLDLMKTEEVTEEEWLNFQKLASVHINSDYPVNIYQKFLSEYISSDRKDFLIQDFNILEKNNLILTPNFDYQKYCANIHEEKADFYCIDEIISKKEEVSNDLRENKKLLDAIRSTQGIEKARVDYSKFNTSQFDINSILFRPNLPFAQNHQLVVFDALLRVIEQSNDQKYCEEEYILPLNAQVERLKHANHFWYWAHNYIELANRIEMLNYLINKKPELIKCFQKLTQNNIEILLGLDNSLRNEYHTLIKQTQSIFNETPWYKSILIKPIKTNNQFAQMYISRIKVNNRNPFIQTVQQKYEGNSFRNWNNPFGALILELNTSISSSFFRLRAAINVAKLNLLSALISYKKCLYENNNECESIVYSYKDPFLSLEPIINQEENTLSYKYPKRNGEFEVVSVYLN